MASPALGPFRSGEPVPLTAPEFHYAFANTMSREESNALYARYAVPASGALLAEHAFANFRDVNPQGSPTTAKHAHRCCSSGSARTM